MLDLVYKLSCARTAQTQRDWHHDGELDRSDTSAAQPSGCNKRSHDGKSESSNRQDQHSQPTSNESCDHGAEALGIAHEIRMSQKRRSCHEEPEHARTEER